MVEILASFESRFSFPSRPRFSGGEIRTRTGNRIMSPVIPEPLSCGFLTHTLLTFSGWLKGWAIELIRPIHHSSMAFRRLDIFARNFDTQISVNPSPAETEPGSMRLAMRATCVHA